MPLPVSYLARLQQVPGVELATHQTWFDGIYRDPANFFANIAVEPERFLRIYPEFKLPPEQMKAWLADRQGAVVGTGSRRALRLEDRRSDSADRDDLAGESGTGAWEFNVVGIYDGDDGIDKTQFFFRYDYLDENAGAGTRAGRLVRREDRGPRAVARAEPDVRRDVRQFSGRDEDHDREGIRRGLREADRRHRRDHDRDLVHGAVHVRPRRRQHDGAVGARAHERACRAEDARVHRARHPRARPRRIAVHRGRGRGARVWRSHG